MTSAAQTPGPIRSTMFHDLVGRSFDFPAPPKRVISLVPSLTETLFDLGVGHSVVGVTDYCIFPAQIDAARIGGTKNPRIEAMRALAPDLVYVNLEENLKRHADQLESFVPVFVTEPKSVADVSALIATVGAIHGRSERATELVSTLERELANARGEAFTFVCPIWKKPWMWCGGDTYVSGLVESVGGRNLLRDRQRYPSLDVTAVLALDPDIVFLPDEPYAFTEADAGELRATSRARIVGPFPGHLFTWHGTRTILGLEFLRGVLRS